jgi:endoglucanase
MRSESLDFLKAVVEAPSPSGYEQPVARLYRDYVSRFADRVATDVSATSPRRSTRTPPSR